jgi:hypothetical protein
LLAGLAGEIGVRGATGDLSDSDGRDVVGAVTMLKESLGLADRSILTRLTEQGIEIFIMKMTM